jgi:hypothetical protein
VNCLACGGACCEDLFQPTDWFTGVSIQTWEWLFARSENVAGAIRIESRCPHLTGVGSCDLHGTSAKPHICRDMPVGGDDCIDAICRRRTPEQYARIREPGDPSEIPFWPTPEGDRPA